MCGAGPGDLGGLRGSVSAENHGKTGPKVFSQTAFRYPGVAKPKSGEVSILAGPVFGPTCGPVGGDFGHEKDLCKGRHKGLSDPPKALGPSFPAGHLFGTGFSGRKWFFVGSGLVSTLFRIVAGRIRNKFETKPEPLGNHLRPGHPAPDLFFRPNDPLWRVR